MIVDFDCIIIGGGPGGTGPLFAAAKSSSLETVLKKRIAIIDAGDELVKGNIGSYTIRSDTAASTFLEVLQCRGLEDLENEKHALCLKEYHNGPVPLPLAADFLNCVGQRLKEKIYNSGVSAFYNNCKAVMVKLKRNGLKEVYFNKIGSDKILCLKAKKVVIATGGHQNFNHTTREEINGVKLAAYSDKLLLSNRILSGIDKKTSSRIELLAEPKLVVIGSSHSAFSAINVLLSKYGDKFGKHGITMLYRTEPKAFFPNTEEAISLGYQKFGAEDICPVTGIIHRLGGLRFDSRSLFLSIVGMKNRIEDRVLLSDLKNLGKIEVEHAFSEADLIIPALGYKPNGINIYKNEEEIKLLINNQGRMVDRNCNILDENHDPIEGVFGIGLASGFVPYGQMGGEPSFMGQTNGIWLYQNGIGEIIANQAFE